MNNIEKLQKEIELTKELLALKEKLLAVEKELGITKIEYIPVYPQYPYYPYTPPFYVYGTTTNAISQYDANAVTHINEDDFRTNTN